MRERLRQENKLLKERLDISEQRFHGVIEGKSDNVSTGTVETVENRNEIETGVENGEKSKDDIIQTHYPAVVMSYDQQCQVILAVTQLPPLT